MLLQNPFVNFCLIVIASVSGLTTYSGLAQSMPDDDFWSLVLVAAVAVASSVAIYTFWWSAGKSISIPRQFAHRMVIWIGIMIGAVTILGFSSFWNVVGIGGATAMRAEMADIPARAEIAFADVQQYAAQFKNADPALLSLQNEIQKLADCEGATGCVSGVAGKKGIHAVLIQLRDKAVAIRSSITASQTSFQESINQGQNCLGELRGAIKSNDDDNIGEQLDCLNGTMAALQSAQDTARIIGDLEGFTKAVVLPISIKTAAQKQAIGNILSGLQTRSNTIAQTLAEKQVQADIDPVTFEAITPIYAVMLHYKQIAPAIVTAVALDWIPLVILLFESTIASSMRSRPDAHWRNYTIGDALDLMEMTKEFAKHIPHLPAPSSDTPEPQNEAPHMRTIDVTERELDLPPVEEEYVTINTVTGEIIEDENNHNDDQTDDDQIKDDQNKMAAS